MPKCLIFQDLERLTEVFGGMSAGISGRKLPLWADFLFLKNGLESAQTCLFFYENKEGKGYRI